MANLAFDTATLVQVVPNLKTAQNFLLDKFFPNLVTFDQEEVAIDIDVGKRRMAPFVSPLVEGKPVEQRRYQTNKFKPAYIKDLRAPDLLKPVRRMIGERIGGELDPGAREMLNLQFEMADQIDIINRRLEWMASSALQTGTVTVTGEGFPSAVIDFGRDAALTVALSGGAQWTAANILAATAIPTDNLTDWRALILKKSGAAVSEVIFTNKAWKAFKQDPALKGAILQPAWAPYGNQLDPGSKIERGGVFMGQWGGLNLWLYNDWYVDANDVEQPMLPDGTVILAGTDLMGTRAFGRILDPEFNYQALPFAPKTWIEKNPAQRWVMMQSAPLVIPSRVNACFAATVN